MTTTPPDTGKKRTADRPFRNQLLRKAGDLTGPEKLGDALGIKSRTIYALMKGDRNVNDGQLRDTRDFLIQRRQQIGMLLALIRNELEETDEDR